MHALPFAGLTLISSLTFFLGLPSSPAPSPSALPRYILLGGGASAYNTQVSLEEHLLRLDQLLALRGVAPAQRSLLFANGSRTTPVVEIMSQAPSPDPLLLALAQILDRQDNLTVTWRPTTLPRLDGPSTRDRLRKALEADPAASSTLLYFAGHGYDQKPGTPVSLSLWNDRLTPKDLSQLLDPLPPSHRVRLVMTQCHAAGFADVLYTEANPKRGLAPHDRCALFASPAEYPAAGCTPEANRANPDDFSTWFQAALAGKRADGASLPSNPDLDSDGQTSLKEAFHFVRLHDGTLDVPVSSSEAFLKMETESLETDGTPSLTTPLAQLLAKARPVDRAALLAQAKLLHLENDPAAPLKARYEADRLASQRTQLLNRIQALEARRGPPRDSLRRQLLERWPWLGNPYHPLAAEYLQKDRDAILELLTRSRERTELDRPLAELRQLRAKVSELERQWARYERLARAAEALVMEAQLRARAPRAKVARLDSLLACEATPL